MRWFQKKKSSKSGNFGNFFSQKSFMWVAMDLFWPSNENLPTKKGKICSSIQMVEQVLKACQAHIEQVTTTVPNLPNYNKSFQLTKTSSQIM